MANIVYTNFVFKLIEQEIDINDMDLRMILLKEEYSPDPSHISYNEVKSAEPPTENGYVEGGQPIQGMEVLKEGTIIKMTCEDVEWENSTVSARYAVLYEEGSGNLVSCYDFGSTKASNAGRFSVNFPEDGFLQIGALEC